MLTSTRSNNSEIDIKGKNSLQLVEAPQIRINQAKIESSVREILINIGEDPQREGLLKTPNRVARMWEELTEGYHTDVDKLINNAIFSAEGYDEMVVVKDIDFHSLCEHHMLPFYGKVHVAYIPNGKVIGLSKIPRIVEMFARRLQIQEQLTTQIGDLLMERLDAEGVAVMIEGAHMCAVMRGVRNHSTNMATTRMLGKFKEDKDLRREFLDQVRHSSIRNG